MKTNYHTHTTRCMHAVGSDEEYVLSAIKGGFQILGFSDHTPWKYRTSYIADMRMLPEELPEYIESLQYLREKYRDQIDIKIGLECEYFPEYIPWLKEQIKKYQLNYILFGNHHFHTDEKFPYFGHHTNNRDMLDLYEESAIEGMESGLYNCLAHPDLFMRSYPKFEGNYECLELFVKPEAGKKGSVSLKKIKENKTEIKELQHIYGNWIKFPTDKDTEYEITAQDCTITFAYLSECENILKN